MQGLALLVALACGPLHRPSPYPGAHRVVTTSRLAGPFDGTVVDAVTSEPLHGVEILAIWSFDRGDGLSAPAGSTVVRVQTDEAGRYRVPRIPRAPRGPALRLSRFVLVAYKRGYRAYRSDRAPAAGPDAFVARKARIRLHKWREQDDHAEHLLVTAPSGRIAHALAWTHPAANAALYQRLTGTVPSAAPDSPTAEGRKPPAKTSAKPLLDARDLVPPEEVVRRTGFVGSFRVGDLGDLPRTSFYHGVHLQAEDHDESWDLAVRVWRAPPGGLTPVRETIEATLSGVAPTDEVTPVTWVYDGEDVRAVAFLDEPRQIAVLLSCGGNLCPDVATAVVLARMVRDRLDRLSEETVSAPTATRNDKVPRKSNPAGTTPPASGAPPRRKGSPPEPRTSPEPTPTEAGMPPTPPPDAPTAPPGGTP